MVSQERSAAARNGLPGFKPYRYNGTGKDIYGGAAGHLADVQPRRAERDATRADEAMPDPAPGWEWHRELTVDDEAAELAAERDRYQAAMAAVPEPRAPAPPPVTVTAPGRCRRCKYLTTSAGHRVMCDD